jgi:hypothetical protein
LQSHGDANPIFRFHPPTVDRMRLADIHGLELDPVEFVRTFGALMVAMSWAMTQETSPLAASSW